MLIVFLALASVQFVALGPARAVRGGLDFAAPYAGAKAWVRGENPYDAGVLERVLKEAQREADADPAFTPALYPPPTFLALLPVVPLRWPAARAAWMLIGLALIALAIRSLVRMSGVESGGPALALVAGGTLALAPFATGIALGQLAIPSIALVVIAMDRIRSGAVVTAASLLTLALLLKPQLPALFVLYLLITGPRLVPAVAVAAYGLATMLSVGWLHFNGIDWVRSLQTNSRAELMGGAIDPRGPLSAQMIDLRPLLSALFDFPAPLWIGTIAALAGACIVSLLARRIDPRQNLLVVANIAVLTLFFGYHRFYDAAMLCIPMAWAVAAWRKDDSRSLALGAIVCIVPFFVSGAWTLQRLGHAGTFPFWVTDAFVWDAFVLRHQTWALLALQVTLITALSRALRQAASPEPRAHPPRDSAAGFPTGPGPGT